MPPSRKARNHYLKGLLDAQNELISKISLKTTVYQLCVYLEYYQSVLRPVTEMDQNKKYLLSLPFGNVAKPIKLTVLKKQQQQQPQTS